MLLKFYFFQNLNLQNGFCKKKYPRIISKRNDHISFLFVTFRGRYPCKRAGTSSVQTHVIYLPHAGPVLGPGPIPPMFGPWSNTFIMQCVWTGFAGRLMDGVFIGLVAFGHNEQGRRAMVSMGRDPGGQLASTSTSPHADATPRGLSQYLYSGNFNPKLSSTELIEMYLHWGIFYRTLWEDLIEIRLRNTSFML